MDTSAWNIYRWQIITYNFLASLVTREMYTKFTVQYCYMTIDMTRQAIKQNPSVTDNSKVVGMWKKKLSQIANM